ncbi:MAG TPA: hypothetical protein VGF52_02550, partial [Tepidisphaeraceae bacterium]
MNNQPVESVFQLKTLADRPPKEAIDFVGNLADAAWSARRTDALRHLVFLAGTIAQNAAEESDRTLLDYYLANIWSGLKCLKGPHPSGAW